MAQELSGGCHGFSHKFMHWQEELLLGGTARDLQGQLLRSGLPWDLVRVLGHPHCNARQFWNKRPTNPQALTHTPAVPPTRAEALQSTFLLMSPRQLYEHFRGDYQTHDIGWSEEQASTVLQTWQRRFVQVSVGGAKGELAEATPPSLPPAPSRPPCLPS